MTFPARRVRLVASLAAVALVASVVFAALRATTGVAQVPAEPATAPAAQVELRDARPLSVRGGIGNFAAKLRDRREVTVAFLGGPITWGGGDQGFAEVLVNWLRVNHPRCPVRFVNAASIDAGSAYGAARYERDVLPHKPDLLLVEFAADDAGKENRLRHVERIVHKAWTADPTLDVVLLYAVTAEDLEHYRAGKLPPAASLHEQVAEHYGIPSVAMGIDAVARVNDGKAKWLDLFYDRLRPTPAGHAAYAEVLVAAMRALLADETAKAPAKHQLKPPLTAELVVYPASRPATTMPAPAPMTLDDGRAARATYAMPLIGVHWVGSPDYTDADGRVLWRLLTQSVRETGRRLNPTFGLDRSRWTPMRWFEEWRHFTGPGNVYLATGNPKFNNVTARQDDLPIVTFTAPRAGRYVMRVKASGIIFWGLHGTLAMNVAHFAAGETRGKSLAFHRTQERIADPPNIQVEVRLNEGDDLAILLDTNATGGGGGAGYRDLDVTVGWFGE